MVTARTYRIRGRVQAVGFRFFAENAARREGVSGWVRNLEDGSVEVHAEGERDALERLELALRRGPASSRVDDVEVNDAVPSGRVTGFHVRG